MFEPISYLMNAETLKSTRDRNTEVFVGMCRGKHDPWLVRLACEAGWRRPRRDDETE
jgi:hypothetical protein